MMKLRQTVTMLTLSMIIYALQRENSKFFYMLRLPKLITFTHQGLLKTHHSASVLFIAVILYV